MHYKKIYKKIESLEEEYNELKKEFKKLSIFKSKKDYYIKEDKEELKIFWGKYIKFFDKLKSLLRHSSYRHYFFIFNYNKLVLRKYLVNFYFKVLLDLIKVFGKHENFVRVFLDENYMKDYGYYAKYLYKAKYLNVLNTPRIFIEPFKSKIDKSVYKLLDNLKELDGKERINADYENMFFYIKYRVDKLLFVISKNVGYLISHLKFSSRVEGLVKKEHIDSYLEIAKPGDIFLSRGNWNASNLSIPGFWKHMSMYIGTGKYLKKNFEGDFLEDLYDESHYIIEATGNGIKIENIYDFAGHIDYLGVIRTIFKKEKIKRTIKNSLSHLGKGYDHIFNYYSDKRLVCSALVLKSYAKENKSDEGIEIELEKIGISLTYPPNNFIKKVREESMKNKHELEGVFFIDSIEKTGENFVSTTEELLKTGERPKLSVFLK